MPSEQDAVLDRAVLDRAGLDAIIDVLRSRGYMAIGPTVRDGAIVLAELESGADLPDGWGVELGPGRYRLRRRADDAVFAHSTGQQSWKSFLHPSRRPLWSQDGTAFVAAHSDSVRYAFIGVRACDLAAINVLSRVLSGGGHPDAAFAGRRERLFVVAVGCTEPGELCFCASLGTGPDPGPGYDLSMVEMTAASGSQFVVTVGSEAGAELLGTVANRPASSAETEHARAAVLAAATRMGRSLPDVDVPSLLRDNRESPVWDDVASRCLTCGNCTMVCPTCFCTTTEDHTDLTGDGASRTQRWASCFELDFSYVHGGSVRTTGASRYRHWITHKLSTWHDQFGSSGCVGCGRCIVWCPVGIDITSEVSRLADSDSREHGDARTR